MLRKIVSVGGWTLASRFTGFGRDLLTAATLGAGPIADAFVVAFRLPNHFRAIFGEGAFNAAFVPSYGRLREQEGDATAQRFTNRVFTLLLGIQIALLALVLTVTPGFVRLLAPGLSDTPATFDLAVALTRITFSYLLTITLVTLISAVLNAHDRFAAAAAAPILLNLSLIAGLTLSYLFPTAAHAAAWGVALAGVLQLVLVWVAAARIGVAPRPASPRGDRELGGFFRRLGPAVVGSAGIQIAMFADTIIASTLPTGALSALYYAERLYQLPLGVVGIAAGTVLLPEMTRRLAAGESGPAHAAQNRAIGFSLALAAPCAVAFVTLPVLILSALFERGAFDSDAVLRSAGVLAAYSAGLPAAVLMRSVVSSFFARHDTTTPLAASLVAYGINIALKIVLIGPFGVSGLAMATAVGIWVNVGLLWLLALRRGWTAPTPALAKTVAAVAIACLVLAGFVLLARDPTLVALSSLGWLRNLAALAILAAGGALLYGASLLLSLRVLGIRFSRR